jgi:hypothetical protein
MEVNMKRFKFLTIILPILFFCIVFLGCGNALSLQVIGDGSVTLDPDAQSYETGAVVTLTAVPSLGGTFLHWGESLTGSTNPATITMDQDRLVAAYFIPYTLAGGTVILTALPSQALTTGAAAIFTANLNLPQGLEYRVWIYPDTFTGASGQNISYRYSASTVLQYNTAGILRGGVLGLYDSGWNWVDYAPGTVTLWKLLINTWDGVDNHEYHSEVFPYKVTWQ